MQIVIDIPKEIYELIINDKSELKGLAKAVKNGTPLSKGHKNAEQKSGKWIDYRDDGFVECPFCGYATNCEDNIDELHYCFYCGAKMK